MTGLIETQKYVFPYLFFFDRGKQHHQNLPQRETERKTDREKETGALKFTTPTCMPTPAAEYSSFN
jgi:hypothetical protein